MSREMTINKVERVLEELKVKTINSEVKDIFSEGKSQLERGIIGESSLVVRGVSAIIIKGLELKATDIHFEIYEKKVRIRLRIDGNLEELQEISHSLYEPMVSRIKILSNLDISEKRLPQDGRVKFEYCGRDIDCRVAIIPTLFGEKVVIRILGREMESLDIKKLGFEKENLQLVERSIYSPNGIILVTGPTGSGKSTTLYSILSKLNREEVNIATVEDPVEYNITGINQVSAKNDIGLTFAVALRQFLRQDPDIIMVGEIRDSETAEIGIKAAMTGHLVFSTIHTNDAVSTINRLVNMGVEPFLIASSLKLIISQRLVKKLCPQCKVLDNDAYGKLRNLSVSLEKLKELTLGSKLEEIKFYKEREGGCENCRNKGYLGRKGVHEVLYISRELANLIESKGSLQDLLIVAKKNGMRELKESALSSAVSGEISLDEIIKISEV